MNSIAIGISDTIGAPLDRSVVADGSLSVELHRDVSALETVWRDLERRAVCTVFQTYRWLSTWLATVGAADRTDPVIVCGRARSGAVVFILPFAIETLHGLRTLEWLGARHANYQLGLFAPEWLAAPGADFTDLWPEIVGVLPPFDLLRFANQPRTWAGHENPLAHLPNTPSANRSHILRLTGDFEAIYAAKRSPSTRRSARKRDRRLECEGLVAFEHATTPAETAAAIDTLLAQKLPHMEAIGVGDVYGPDYPGFLKALAVPDVETPSPLDLRCLKCGDEIIAVVLGAISGGRYCGLILSMTDGPLRRHSPGELALRRTIEACCQLGLEEFDLSQGEASYKEAWTDEVLDQFDTVIGYSAAGRAWAAAAGARLWAKRHIKQSPHLLAAVTMIRKAVLGRSAAG